MSQITGPGHAVLDVQSERIAHRSAVSMLSQLTKPRITLMVVITAYIGFELGRRGGADALAPREAFASRPLIVTADWLLLTITMVGTALACMGASILNQVFER